MNQLLSLGLILLLALLAGHLAKALRVPEVTGYILAGVAVGPSGLGWINQENLSALSVFSEVALGLILFSIGSAFEFQRVRKLGRALVRVTGIESLLAAGFVFLAMLAFGQSWQVALLLGAIAMETAAASTLMVVRECGASGPLTDTLIGVIGLNNNLGLLGTIGALGIVYVLCRAAGKFLGARIGAHRAGLPLQVQRLLGFALMSQAGLAVGLTLTVSRRFPDYAPPVVAIVLASVIVYETIGPVSARFAILRSGEARDKTAPDKGRRRAGLKPGTVHSNTVFVRLLTHGVSLAVSAGRPARSALRAGAVQSGLHPLRYADSRNRHAHTTSPISLRKLRRAPPCLKGSSALRRV